jgi:hypothetical protein
VIISQQKRTLVFKDFSFPGITFATQRFDDGVKSTCFTWEVVLEGAPEGSTIKGISFYEVNENGLITYVRGKKTMTCSLEKLRSSFHATQQTILSLFFLYIKDVPESGLKPPPLGKLARQLRPTVGVFQPVSIGSRDPL